MADETLSRRTLLGRGAVMVAAGVAGFVVAKQVWSRPVAGASGPNGYGAAAPVAAGALLAPLASVPAGGGIVLPGPEVVLTLDRSGGIHGFSAICTHQGCTVAQVANGTIDCPCHGSRFNAFTGAVVQGPAARPLPRVAVVVRGAGVYRA